MMMRLTILVFCFLTMFLSSCGNKLYFKMLGLKSMKRHSEAKIGKLYKKRGELMLNKNYYVADQNYVMLLNRFTKAIPDTNLRKATNNYYIQTLNYYLYDGNVLLTALPNCMADFRTQYNLTWNKRQELETFPPKYTYALKHYIPKDSLLTALDKFGTGHQESPTRYTAFVLWGYFGGRQTKNFLREVSKNIAMEKDITVRYVFIDNIYNPKTAKIAKRKKKSKTKTK
ncbi:MAG: hypothetical protein EAZ57_04360 [Cytophagales bacterium]|nr:MAG: hypothetical protein EAZ67_05380 [Cytophagales bacterium]TAF61229.1 MAG: hypothetical protein EAZ57_04360 [Cytophagales bacterium]